MSKRLHVGNLSADLDETGLEGAFAQWGGRAATIPFDRATGRSKGFGFLDVDDDQVNAAMSAMNGAEVAGLALTVSEARPRVDRGADARTART